VATATSQAGTGKSGFLYGWLIVAVSTLAMLVTNGLSIGGLPVFFKPMLTDLASLGSVQPGDRSVTAYASSITFWTAGLAVLLAGWLVGRVRLRALMTIGCLLLCAALLIYSRATAPAQVYAAHFLFGLTLAFAGLMVNTVLISNWFRRLRGTAMGIIVTGTSLGSVLIPKIAEPLITNYGWRTAMLTFGGAVLVVLLPAVLFIVRDFPRECGLAPDGDAPMEESQSAVSSAPVLPGLTLREAMRTTSFWMFALCAAMLFYTILVVVQQFILYLQSPQIGMSLKEATNAQAAMGLASIFGKLFFGWLCDHIKRSLAFIICCVWLFLATLVLLSLKASIVYLFLIPFGIGYGGSFAVIQVFAVERFGLREAGRILSAITVCETLGGATGLFLTGLLAGQYGYTIAFHGVIVAAAIALVTSLLARSTSVIHHQQGG
jgi:sugar phosphate permease